MVRLAERVGVPWSLCYAGRHRDSLPFLDELLAFGDKVRARGGRADSGVRVRPPPMLEAIRRSIPLDSGTELHVERFSPLPVVDGTLFELELARS